jgi:hypothetical protein
VDALLELKPSRLRVTALAEQVISQRLRERQADLKEPLRDALIALATSIVKERLPEQ